MTVPKEALQELLSELFCSSYPLTKAEKSLLLVLSKTLDQDGWNTTNNKDLIDMTSYSLKTIQICLKNLEDNKIIIRETIPIYDDLGWGATQLNRYQRRISFNLIGIFNLLKTI
jgi:hypothetical protein